MESRKTVLMNLFARQQWKHTHRDQTWGHSGEGEGGTNWESRMETYTLPHVKRITSGNLLCDSGSSNWCSWQPRGLVWHGRWEGGSRERGHVYSYGWFVLMYGRDQHNIIKQLSSNSNKSILKIKKQATLTLCNGPNSLWSVLLSVSE